MQVSDEMIARIKHVEFEMLEEVIKCCNVLKIKVYLDGGTALGAVRHQGFIPWDDDIDVGMLRKDFEIFISEGQRYLPKYLFLQSRLSEPNFLCNFAKIRDSRTTFIESSQRQLKINHGVYIDVFPLDYYPENSVERDRIQKKLRVLNLRVRQEFTLPEENRGTRLLEIWRKFGGDVLKLRYPSVSKVLDLRETIYKSVKPSSYLVNYCGAWGNKEVFPTEWLEEGTIANFEGLSVNIPKEYDKYLRHIYGDYMQLPPENMRVSHHYTEIIDLDKPYTDYI